MTQSSSSNSAGSLVSDMLSALERRDFEYVEKFYADDIEMWHSFSNSIEKKDNALKMLKGLDGFKDFSYDIQEQYVDGDKVFQRHVLHVTKLDGSAVEIPAAVFITVKNGQISKVFEYMDPSPLV